MNERSHPALRAVPGRVIVTLLLTASWWADGLGGAKQVGADLTLFERRDKDAVRPAGQQPHLFHDDGAVFGMRPVGPPADIGEEC